MTAFEIIQKAAKNGEMALDIAGLLLSVGDKKRKELVKKYAVSGELALDIAGQILMAN